MKKALKKVMNMQLEGQTMLLSFLSLTIIFIASFTLHPINMGGFMSAGSLLSELEVNIAITVPLLIWELVILIRNRELTELVYAKKVMAILLFIVVAYFFFETEFLEGQKAKPDLDRYYPADEENYIYCLVLIVIFWGMPLIGKRMKQNGLEPTS